MLSYEQVRALVENRLILKTDNTPFEELSVQLFGEKYGESEVRRRMWGMHRLIEIIEGQKEERTYTKILSLSDLHIPFQLDFESLAAFRYVDILQLNGDIIDCQALSKFSKQYRISPMEELIQGRQYLIDLIEYIQPKKVVCNYGNHDKRFASYFAKNLDTDILELMPDTSLELIFVDGFRHYNKREKTKIEYEPLQRVFESIDIEFVNNWHSRIGKTIFAHPMAYRSNFLATADKAKQYFQDTEKEPFDCICMAHTHKIGDTMSGNIRLLEQGAFAHIDKMNYMDGKLTAPQKSGFALIYQDEQGNIINEKSKIYMI